MGKSPNRGKDSQTLKSINRAAGRRLSPNHTVINSNECTHFHHYRLVYVSLDWHSITHAGAILCRREYLIRGTWCLVLLIRTAVSKITQRSCARVAIITTGWWNFPRSGIRSTLHSTKLSAKPARVTATSKDELLSFLRSNLATSEERSEEARLGPRELRKRIVVVVAKKTTTTTKSVMVTKPAHL